MQWGKGNYSGCANRELCFSFQCNPNKLVNDMLLGFGSNTWLLLQVCWLAWQANVCSFTDTFYTFVLCFWLQPQEIALACG